MSHQVFVAFGTKKLKSDFKLLGSGKQEELLVHKDILKSMSKFKSDMNIGKKIPRRLWPKFYTERHILDNLWKLNLSNGWRLIYTIKFYEEQKVFMILEWFSHKDYEKRFGY